MQTDNETIFLHAGEIWENQFEINFGDGTYTPIQLSLRPDAPDNSAESEEKNEQLTQD